MRAQFLIVWGLGLSGCGRDPIAADSDTTPEPIIEETRVYLEDVDFLIRVSTALRGIRPSVDEMASVRADPAVLDEIIDGYLASPEFLEVMKDLHSEMLLLRTDAIPQLPALGLMDRENSGSLYQSTTGEPLELIRYIIENDRPYTEVVTADYLLADRVVADIYDLDYDDAGPTWQVTQYSDGRPPAGLLSSPEMMLRHESNAANFHRARANFVASAFLCEDFNDRDITVEGGIDIADEFEVANAVRTHPACVNCHQTLDPLAAYFWGFRGTIHANEIVQAYDDNCSWDFSDGTNPTLGPSYLPEYYCYPLKQYTVADESEWQTWDLREPSFYGQPARDLSDVGELIANDPRFAQCMSRQFFGWLAHLEPEDVPMETVVSLQSTFVDSGFDAKALARAVILHESFRASGDSVSGGGHLVARMRSIRPEQYARTVEDLTGYRWFANVDGQSCDDGPRGDECWGTVDLSSSDRYGFRTMAGGIDGYYTVRPIHVPTPIKLLVNGQLANDAAAWVVDADALLAPEDRRLFAEIDLSATHEAGVRGQLVALYERLYGEQIDPYGEEADEAWELFSVFLDSSGRDATRAWKVTLGTLLQDPRMLWY